MPMWFEGSELFYPFPACKPTISVASYLRYTPLIKTAESVLQPCSNI